MSLFELELACGERLDIHRFSIRESISSPFTVEVLARSPDPDLDLDAIADHPAVVRIGHAGRLWSGLCSRACLAQGVELHAGEAALSTYELTIVPWLWLLTQRIDQRIFQHRSIPEIARAVLDPWGIEPELHLDAASHPRLPYRVQHNESDLDFLVRLLEEAGIAATFSDDDGERSRLVLSDALHRSAPRRPAPLIYVDSPNERTSHAHATRLFIANKVRPKAVTLRDHDFRRPAYPLTAQARSPEAEASTRREHYRYQPGAFLVSDAGRASGAAAPADRHDDRHGAALATRALGRARSGRHLIRFETNAADLRPGTIVTIEGHSGRKLDPRVGLLVTSIALDGTPHGAWTIRVEAVPADEPYYPPQQTTKPVAYGPERATVISPPGQEIHTDEHGRVQVQFHWDREGQTSCWLHVAQGWAGPGMGLFTVPRVGQEVLVSFERGDPDKPIVTARVSNARNPPPLKLPDDRTQSVWRSATSPGGEGFSEIRFEDRRGAELLAL
ncbi:MAG TPA: type VI secretion system tip protein TssI/VgrG, partial [Bacilli bacterium]|nr:type VI secretion system tip protein TssI/VgrG [Bacilli bacterium]